MDEPIKAPLIRSIMEAIVISIASLIIGAVISSPFLDILNIKSGPVARAFTVIHAFMVQSVWYVVVFFRLDPVMPKVVSVLVVPLSALMFGSILAFVTPVEWLGLDKFFGREGSVFLIIFLTQSILCCYGMNKLRREGPTRLE
jgi:hypothetical protein